MTNYSIFDSHVRCSKFKPSGKWYDDFMIDMTGHWETRSVHNSVAECIIKAEGLPAEDNYDWWYVVLDPYCECAFPIMINATTIRKYSQTDRKIPGVSA